MNQTQLNVNGMSCASCVRHINQALTAIDGVREVDVRLREGRVLVRHEANVETEALRSAVEEAGYGAEIVG